MPWKECSVVDERLKFVAHHLAGEPMAELCREYGISRKTGYKIFDRYQDSVCSSSDPVSIRVQQEHHQCLSWHAFRPVRNLDLAQPIIACKRDDMLLVGFTSSHYRHG